MPLHVNDMPLQIQNGLLLQYADDTCLVVVEALTMMWIRSMLFADLLV